MRQKLKLLYRSVCAPATFDQSSVFGDPGENCRHSFSVGYFRPFFSLNPSRFLTQLTLAHLFFSSFSLLAKKCFTVGRLISSRHETAYGFGWNNSDMFEYLQLRSRSHT